MAANRPMQNGSVDVTPPPDGVLNDTIQIPNTLLIVAAGLSGEGPSADGHNCSFVRTGTGTYEVALTGPADPATVDGLNRTGLIPVATIVDSDSGGGNDFSTVKVKQPTLDTLPFGVFTFDETGTAANRQFSIVFLAKHSA